MTNTVNCGKFDDYIPDYYKIIRNLSNNSKDLLRIGSKKKSKDPNYVFASTNGDIFVTLDKIENVRDFIYNNKNILVLTIKEKLLVIEDCLNNRVNIKAFEEIFPIFKEIKYISNPSKNLEYLLHLVDKVKSHGYNLSSLAIQLSDNYQYKVERKLRKKSFLDSVFYFSIKPGYQEVFKLKEERINKKIIALDFNSMYLDCMKGQFPDPRYLEYAEFNCSISNINTLYSGTYSVILKRPNNKKFMSIHPFKYTNKNSSISFNLDKNSEIHTDLLDNEIEFYKYFFEDVYVKNGVFSKKTILHPLVKNGLEEHLNRRNYTKLDYKYNLAKYKIILMHSCTNRNYYKKKKFNSLIELIDFIREFFFIDIDNTNYNTYSLIKTLKSYRSIFPSLKIDKNELILEYLDYQSYNNIYSLSSKILANSRIKMIKSIMKILEFKSAELCYSNIDSIHVSIDENRLEQFISFINPLLSPDAGKLKIESIASKGYWFDLGRFWLFEDNNVVKFANAGIKNSKVNNIFSESRVIKKISKAHGIYYAYNRYMSIYKGFSLKKHLPDWIDHESHIDEISFMRYDHDVEAQFYFMNSVHSLVLKKSLFKRISTV